MISDQARKLYTDKSATYRKKIAKLRTLLQEDDGRLKKTERPEMLRIAIASRWLDVASYYLVLNNNALVVLEIKNEGYLNEARRCCYQSVIQIEKTITDQIDVSFSEYSEQVAKIAEIPELERFALIRRLGFTVQATEESFGHNSKWRWSFVELFGRFAAAARNVIDLKELFSKLDPQADGYTERMIYVELLKRLFRTAADRYRERYELNDNRATDMKTAIAHLAALLRLYRLLSETELIEKTKKQIEIWTMKMKNDAQRDHFK